MHQVKTKAGTFGGMTITAIGPEEALRKARELAELDGLSDVVIVDPKGDVFDVVSFEQRLRGGKRDGADHQGR